MSQRFAQNPWLTDVFTTANATATASTNCGYVVPSGAQGYAELVVIGRRTSDNAVATYWRRAEFRNVSGTLTISATFDVLGGSSGNLASTSVAFISSGTTIEPQVTGVAATNIEWFLDARYNVN